MLLKQSDFHAQQSFLKLFTIPTLSVMADSHIRTELFFRQIHITIFFFFEVFSHAALVHNYVCECPSVI